ncbi:MAG: TetR/AcrR family transcriptional regulator [Ktedonobacterales bacterium]
MSTESAENLGLRERKKLATRRALGWAALRLAAEHGLENVRVEDIAAAADVSPRTFNNYFSSKEDAIVSLAIERAAKIGDALRERPANEPLADALFHAFVQQYAPVAEPEREWVTQIRLAASTPTLLGEYLTALVRCERPLAEAIAERIGTDASHDLYPRVLAAAVFGTARVALQHWLNVRTTTSFASVLRQAIEQIVGGSQHATPDKGGPG